LSTTRDCTFDLEVDHPELINGASGLGITATLALYRRWAQEVLNTFTAHPALRASCALLIILQGESEQTERNTGRLLPSASSSGLQVGSRCSSNPGV